MKVIQTSINCHTFTYQMIMEKMHCHESIEVNYVKFGSAIYYIDNQEVLLNKGDILLLNANYPHKLVTVGNPINLISMEISTDYIHSNCPFEWHDDFIDQVITDKLAQLVFSDISDSFYSNGVTDYIKYGIGYLLQVVKKSEENTAVFAAKSFIANNYIMIKSVDDVSSHLNMSTSHLQRLFKCETGTSIGNYINMIKLKNAAFLLTNTHIPIGEIDVHVGINSRQSFYIAFKKMYHMSPMKYRSITSKTI